MSITDNINMSEHDGTNPVESFFHPYCDHERNLEGLQSRTDIPLRIKNEINYCIF